MVMQDSAQIQTQIARSEAQHTDHSTTQPPASEKLMYFFSVENCRSDRVSEFSGCSLY